MTQRRRRPAKEPRSCRHTPCGAPPRRSPRRIHARTGAQPASRMARIYPRCPLPVRVAAGLLYGQVTKTYRHRRLVRVRPVMRCGTRAQFHQALAVRGLTGTLNTAFVERLNLTLRQSIAALARRTWSTAREAPQLLAHLDWWRAYYHFVRPHRSLRVVGAQPGRHGGGHAARQHRQRTPAMAAGLTDRRWTTRELLLLPLPTAARGPG